MDENFASVILLTALREGRSAELLDCLFNGGSCTVDSEKRLVLLSGTAIQQLAGNT